MYCLRSSRRWGIEGGIEEDVSTEREDTANLWAGEKVEKLSE